MIRRGHAKAHRHSSQIYMEHESIQRRGIRVPHGKVLKQRRIGNEGEYPRYEMRVDVEALVVEVAPAGEAGCYGGKDGTVASVDVRVFAVPLGDLGDGEEDGFAGGSEFILDC